MKFKADDVLLHKKSNRKYRILIAADTCRLEADGAPAYAYQLKDSERLGDLTVWVRAATEMEDGRFDRLEDTGNVR